MLCCIQYTAKTWLVKGLFATLLDDRVHRKEGLECHISCSIDGMGYGMFSVHEFAPTVQHVYQFHLMMRWAWAEDGFVFHKQRELSWWHNILRFKLYHPPTIRETIAHDNPSAYHKVEVYNPTYQQWTREPKFIAHYSESRVLREGKQTHHDTTRSKNCRMARLLDVVSSYRNSINPYH